VEVIPQELLAVRRMADFRGKLQAVNGSMAMAYGGDGTSICRGQRQKIAVHGLRLIAVTHPDGSLRRHVFEQPVSVVKAALRRREWRCRRRRYIATEQGTCQLHAVTDAKDRNAEVENSRVAVGGAG